MLLRLLKGGKTAIKDKPKDEVAEVTFNPIESQEMDAATKGDRSEKGDKDKREDKTEKPYDWKRDKKEVLTKTEMLLHTDASKFLDAVDGSAHLRTAWKNSKTCSTSKT